MSQVICSKCNRIHSVEHKYLPSSVESSIDKVSCLYCVKCLFYHFQPEDSNDDDSSSWADSPCSCASSRSCLSRWVCLVSLSFVFPCLLSYWPLRVAFRVVEQCKQNDNINCEMVINTQPL